jgi:uncharacterized protein involved in exopolysaccharide biosynthesis
MIRKILEAFFQHKLVLLLPPILITAIVTVVTVMSTPPVYETAVGIWIDRPAYINYKETGNAWVSAVQSQSTRLGELLRTRAFQNDVANRTSLAALTQTPQGQSRLADLMQKSIAIGGATTTTAAAASEHLMVVRVQTGSPQLSYELSKAIVDAYQEKTAADQADQTNLAVDFYKGRVQEAQQRLTKAQQDLRRYAASKPDELSQDQNSALAAMLDPRLGSLQTAVQSAQLDFNNAQGILAQSQQDAAAAAQGDTYGFQVLDPPQLPTAPTPQIKKMIIYPVAAAVVGLALSGMLLVLFVAADRSVRTETDLLPGLRVLGGIPNLDLKRVPKQLRPVATRRAIGAYAGAALPSPGGAR